MQTLDHIVKYQLNALLAPLEDHFNADCIFYYGPIVPNIEKPFSNFIEELKSDPEQHDLLVMLLNTQGGMAETVEKLVEIIRHHYSEVYFVVPDEAMSAGTIMCMSGDKIYMDYRSSLGPIDPQVFNGEEMVPALGYLDQVERMIQKSQKNELTHAEFLLLQKQDLAILSKFEQAKNLTITLVEKWLVEYKFKDWKVHKNNPKLKGKKVTASRKRKRAIQIAENLSSNTQWHSHGRKISAKTLNEIVRLKIEDYSKNLELRNMITEYNELLLDYIKRHDLQTCIHSRRFFGR